MANVQCTHEEAGRRISYAIDLPDGTRISLCKDCHDFIERRFLQRAAKNAPYDNNSRSLLQEFLNKLLLGDQRE